MAKSRAEIEDAMFFYFVQIYPIISDPETMELCKDE